MARVLRWGAGYTGGEDPINLLRDVIEAEEIRLDRWTVVFHPDDKPDDGAQKMPPNASGKKKKVHQAQLQQILHQTPAIMTNILTQGDIWTDSLSKSAESFTYSTVPYKNTYIHKSEWHQVFIALNVVCSCDKNKKKTQSMPLQMHLPNNSQTIAKRLPLLLFLVLLFALQICANIHISLITWKMFTSNKENRIRRMCLD